MSAQVRRANMEPFEFIDDHSGTFVAVATIVLAGVTATYVLLTNRLVRAQHLGTKREIVEKLYRPIRDALEEMIWGGVPSLET